MTPEHEEAELVDVEEEIEETEVEETEVDTETKDSETEETETPVWMSEEDEQETSETVPVSAIMKVKSKLKAKLHDRDEEVERLTTENASLRAKGPVASTLDKPKRPRINDFDDDDTYEEALDTYEEDKLDYQKRVLTQEQGASQQQAAYAKELDSSVDEHYERAAKLIETNSISPDVYKQADEAVKLVIEGLIPKSGEQVFNRFVNIIGEGSEKTMFYVGRNKAAQKEFKHILAEDKTGLKAAFHLGRLTEKMNGTKKQSSRAPKPTSQIRGDEAGTVKGSAIKKKYEAAHTKGDTQAAYNLKKQARGQGIDTTSWR